MVPRVCPLHKCLLFAAALAALPQSTDADIRYFADNAWPSIMTSMRQERCRYGASISDHTSFVSDGALTRTVVDTAQVFATGAYAPTSPLLLEYIDASECVDRIAGDFDSEDQGLAMRDVVRSWRWEFELYYDPWSEMVLTTDEEAYSRAECYINLIWRDVSSVGCAVHLNDDWTRDTHWHLVCFFREPGNIPSLYAAQIPDIVNTDESRCIESSQPLGPTGGVGGDGGDGDGVGGDGGADSPPPDGTANATDTGNGTLGSAVVPELPPQDSEEDITWEAVGFKVSATWPRPEGTLGAWVNKLARTLALSFTFFDPTATAPTVIVMFICPLLDGYKPWGDDADLDCVEPPLNDSIARRSGSTLAESADEIEQLWTDPERGVYVEVLLEGTVADVEAGVVALTYALEAARVGKPPLAQPSNLETNLLLVRSLPFAGGSTTEAVQQGTPATPWSKKASVDWKEDIRSPPREETAAAPWVWGLLVACTVFAAGGVVALIALRRPLSKKGQLNSVTVSEFYKSMPAKLGGGGNPLAASNLTLLLPEEHYCNREDDGAETASFSSVELSCSPSSKHHNSFRDLNLSGLGSGLGPVRPMGCI